MVNTIPNTRIPGEIWHSCRMSFHLHCLLTEKFMCPLLPLMTITTSFTRSKVDVRIYLVLTAIKKSKKTPFHGKKKWLKLLWNSHYCWTSDKNHDLGNQHIEGSINRATGKRKSTQKSTRYHQELEIGLHSQTNPTAVAYNLARTC